MTLAHYATTTPFYAHVVEALSRNYESVSLQRRFQLDQRAFERLSKFATPSLRQTLSRRVQAEVAVDRLYTLRRWSFEPALYSRFGKRMTAAQLANLTRRTAREVQRRSRGADVLQFTDGIGHLALRDREHQLTVMERRHVHHDVPLEPVTLWDGFPLRPSTGWGADLLNEEYARADCIVVYSDFARSTFLSRGFDPSVVHTVHRAATSLPMVPDVRRDPSLAIFVGRGDADKGLDLAVGAVESLNGAARLKVAGPISRDVRNWLGSYQNVEYVGILNRLQLAHLYAKATLLIQPSVESFGLAMTDAASVGVRVLCADTAGIGPELGSRYSSVVSGRDVEEWANALRSDLESETDELRYERAMDGSIATRFSWRASGLAMEELHKVLRERHGLMG